MSWKLDKCCFCVELEIFGYILGGLHLLSNVLSIIGQIGQHSSQERKQLEVFYSYTGYQEPFINVFIKDYLPWLIIIPSMIICILWLVGINKKNHRFMLPYVILQSIAMVIAGIALVIYAIIYLIALITKFSQELLIIVIMSLIVVVPLAFLSVHIYLAILSLYTKIRDEEAGVYPGTNTNKGVIYSRPGNVNIQTV